MNSNAVSLRQFGYKMALNIADRQEALKRAMAFHGVEAVKARLEELKASGAGEVGYPGVVVADLAFVKGDPAVVPRGVVPPPPPPPPMPSRALVARAARDALKTIHARLAVAIDADDTEAIVLLIESMKKLVSLL